MYQLNKAYSKKELAEEVFGISPNTLKARSTMYMNHLKEYFEVRTIPNGRWEKYVLVKELKPWKTYREVYEESSQKTIEDYRDAAKVVLEKEPRNTIKNVANEIRLNKEIRRYDHSEETGRKWTGKAMNTYFTSGKGAWCEKLKDGTYRVCTEDEVSWLRKLRYDYRNQNDEDKQEKWFVALNQKQNGEITDEDLGKKAIEIYGSYYEKVIGQFRLDYGFFPIWVKEWR